MSTLREPVLKPVPIAGLRPTQITVGMREVHERRRHWQSLGGKRQAYLDSHMIPVILGPRDRHYILDHHHLARALHEEGIDKMLVTVVADLSRLDSDTFWFVLDCRDWMHPFDAKGRRRSHLEIPKSVIGLIDDPFRSLAGALRRAGGYSKETTPYSEFLWADFLRRRMKRKLVLTDFSKALRMALALAKLHDAGYLPGWCGSDKPDKKT